jgi:YD repeat-containing protein
MKKLSIIICVLVLVLGSCASSQGSGVSGAAAQSVGSVSSGGGAASGAGASSGQTAVEIKSLSLFPDGSVDEYTVSNYDPSYSTLLNQNRYSASGALLEQIEFTFEKNLLTKKITRDAENKIKTQVTYQYNNRGNLERETLINKSGAVSSSYEYAYDTRGNRISRVVNSGKGVKLAETVYSYNNASQIVSSEATDGFGRKIGSTRNQYDSQGNLISQRMLNADGVVTAIINTVWQNGLEAESKQTSANGEVQLEVKNEFGSEGELIRKTVNNFQGKSTRITQYEYTFRPGRR